MSVGGRRPASPASTSPTSSSAPAQGDAARGGPADLPGRGRVAAAARGDGRPRAVHRATRRSSASPARPGVGKSTSTNALVAALRGDRQAGRRARRRPVLAVLRRRAARRPGADAGPRARPGGLHPLDGLARPPRRPGVATPQALRVLDAAGCDVVLVETVGVGQTEVEIAGARRHHAGAARARAWATASRPRRPASSRSATSSWSTRPTGTAPTRCAATCATCSRSAERADGRLAAADRADRRADRPGRRRGRREDRRAPRLDGVGRRARPAPGTTGARRDRGDRGDRAAPALGQRARAHRARRRWPSRSWPGASDPYAAADSLLETYTD